MSGAPTTEITLTCHCKSQSFTANVPTSVLPLPAHLCHCNSCRRCLGTLNSSSVHWPSPLPENHSLQHYQFGKSLAILSCGKCSQHIFWLSTDSGSLEAFTACLPPNKGLVEFNEHIFVDDTKDGGISQWLLNPHKGTAPDTTFNERWSGYDKKTTLLPPEWPTTGGLKAEDELTGGDTVAIRCHCGGIDLTLARPDYPSVDKDKVPWNVEPTTRRKWLAVLDVCDSCRLTFSAEFVPLAYVDMKSIHSSPAAKSPFPSNITALSEAVANGDPAIGTLAKYQSSATAFRFHCSKCFASFCHATDRRPEVLAIAPGLLDSPDGARAEGMLWWPFSWDEPVGFEEDIKGSWREQISGNFALEWAQWRKDRGWPVKEKTT